VQRNGALCGTHKTLGGKRGGRKRTENMFDTYIMFRGPGVKRLVKRQEGGSRTREGETGKGYSN